MRTIKYIGNQERIDLRPAFGFKTDDISKEALRFVFHARTSRENPQEGARQYEQGVQMTNEQALELMRYPYRPEGFIDVTEGDPAPAIQPHSVAPPPPQYETPTPVSPDDLIPAVSQPKEPKPDDAAAKAAKK